MGGGVKSGTNLAECTPLSALPTVRAVGTRPYRPPKTQTATVRQTGQKCPCIVGTYKSVKQQCSDAKCGGQAHHIVADKYLRLGTRPAPGATDLNRIKGMPSLNDGPSICLNGNAGDEDTDHNIAHQNDGLIQSLGDAHNLQGTLPIGQIQKDILRFDGKTWERIDFPGNAPVRP